MAGAPSGSNRILDDIDEIRAASLPAKDFESARWIGNEARGIAGASRRHRRRNLAPEHLTHRGDHLAHREAATGAEVQGSDLFAALEVERELTRTPG